MNPENKKKKGFDIVIDYWPVIVSLNIYPP